MSYPLNKASLDARPVPAWYLDAKLGIFVHWGLYSVPAFADGEGGDFADFMDDLTSGEDIRGRMPYAEWYLNALRTPGSPTAAHHAATYGTDFSYYDFRRQFDDSTRTVDLHDWARTFADTGAEYVVLVCRHLDGYPLWPTDVPNPAMPAGFHPPRDVVGELTSAVREHGLRMGLYYAGGTDWTFTDKPITTMTDLMDQSSLGDGYARYATAHWRELIERYQPSLLWNDMGWPKESDPHEIFGQYYATVADGVVNDRWEQVKLPDEGLGRDLYLGMIGVALRIMHKLGKSVPRRPPKVHADFRTFEYELPDTPQDRNWELTRGLGNSFGYNAAETADDLLSGTELVRLLVDVVARGGKLLLNVGPDGRGRIPETQLRPLRELGGWLDKNGAAIFATTPFGTNGSETADGVPVRYTQRDGTVYAIVMADVVAGEVVLRGVSLPAGARATVLGTGDEVSWRVSGDDVEVRLPELGDAPAHVVSFTGR